MASCVSKMKQKTYYKLCLMMLLLRLGECTGAPTTKSLEQVPKDLTWDDWLKQEHQDNIPPRRITTKSLFVFPNLGTDSLPACAEGYRPDALGRCVKVVKVNESAHLEFLLQKLNSQFAPSQSGSESDEVYDYDTEPDTSDGPGPFQVNIPFALAHNGHKTDQNDQGEYIHVSKKDPPSTFSENANVKPTPSSEIVPEYFNNQFFPGNPPAEAQGAISPNNSDSAGGLSILFHNTTNIGLTLLVPSNGKIDNISEDKNNNTESIESDEKKAVKVTTKLEILTTPASMVETAALTMAKDENQKKENVGYSGDSDVSHEKDKFIQQIESLKTKPEGILESSQKHLSSEHPAKNLYPIQHNNKNTNSGVMDIEEKIKMISKFADVSRNTDKDNDRKINKPSSDYVRFPDGHSDYDYMKPLDLLPVPSIPVEIPVNSHGIPIPQNSVYNTHPIDNYNKFQPLYYDKNFSNEEKYKPHWLPYGWDIHRSTNGEHNLIDFWSKLSMVQRYPYNVRFHQEHRPTQYPSLYPNSRNVGSRLNVRHTATNHRQGREDQVKRHRLYQGDAINYKRSLHPHFRESNGYSHPRQAYNRR